MTRVILEKLGIVKKASEFQPVDTCIEIIDKRAANVFARRFRMYGNGVHAMPKAGDLHPATKDLVAGNPMQQSDGTWLVVYSKVNRWGWAQFPRSARILISGRRWLAYPIH